MYRRYIPLFIISGFYIVFAGELLWMSLAVCCKNDLLK